MHGLPVRRVGRRYLAGFYPDYGAVLGVEGSYPVGFGSQEAVDLGCERGVEGVSRSWDSAEGGCVGFDYLLGGNVSSDADLHGS